MELLMSQIGWGTGQGFVPWKDQLLFLVMEPWYHGLLGASIFSKTY